MSHSLSRSPAFALAAAALASLSLASPSVAQQKPVPTSDPLIRMNDAVDALTRKVWPSVVQIVVF